MWHVRPLYPLRRLGILLPRIRPADRHPTSTNSKPQVYDYHAAPLSPPLSTIVQETSHLYPFLAESPPGNRGVPTGLLDLRSAGVHPRRTTSSYRWSGLLCLRRSAYVFGFHRSRGHRVTLLRSFPTRQFALSRGLGRPVVMVKKAGVGATPPP